MKAFVVLSLLASSLALSELEYQASFTSWMQVHQKSYQHEEFQLRYQIFKSNLDFINDHNAQDTGMTLAMNEFGDLSKEEFKKFYLGMDVVVEDFEPITSEPDLSLPAEKDWRKEGAVTGVKNQGQCGSCWSFSTTGSTEGCHKLRTGSLVSLSEQNLIDCSTSYGNQGCNGGLMTSAMKYIINNHGIDTESSYPYTTSGPNQCHFTKDHVGATLSSYVDVSHGDENDLQAKANDGPVSVAIDASESTFQFYSSGVYYAAGCSSSRLDHGVLVVGWGVEGGKDYWLVKNSWGPSWGLNGYILMSRNRNNNCGIASSATLPKC